MKEQIQLLVSLQEVDIQMDLHQGNLVRLPNETQELARNLVVIRREISVAQERLSLVEKSLKQKERDLANEQEKIRRSEKRLLSIKNEKEYNALSREVKLGKKVVGELEESILELMQEAENLNKSISRKQSDYEEFEVSLNEKKAETERAGKEAQEALGSLSVERDKIAQGVERDFLKRYDTVKKGRGNPMTELIDGSCGECHMTLPAQQAIRVLKQEEMLTCPNCQRILYVKPENIPEYNKLEA
ncbi:zinc ribbon domain-containing protein [Thermodesulfobacteriota bacterium]